MSDWLMSPIPETPQHLARRSPNPLSQNKYANPTVPGGARGTPPSGFRSNNAVNGPKPAQPPKSEGFKGHGPGISSKALRKSEISFYAELMDVLHHMLEKMEHIDIYKEVTQEVQGKFDAVIRKARKEWNDKIVSEYTKSVIEGYASVGLSPDTSNLNRPMIEALIDTSPLWKSFNGMTNEMVNHVHQIFAEAVVDPRGLNMNAIKEAIQSTCWNLGESRIRNIARTETTAITNKGRELAYIDQDPNGAGLYKWIGPDDERTTDICKEIKHMVGNGKPLAEVKAIIDMVSTQHMKSGYEARDWSPHFQCRHRLVRVY